MRAAQHLCDTVREQLQRKLALTEQLGAVRLDLFGSSVTGFGSHSSDLDMCLRFDAQDPEIDDENHKPPVRRACMHAPA